jgi:drug/metabolite transporter (DMT)-like permease
VLANLNGLDFSFTLMGEGFVFIGTVMAALGSSLTKIYAKNIPVSTLTGYQFLLGGVLLVVCGVAFSGSLQFPTVGSVLIFLYLAFSAAVAQTVWSALLKHNEVSQIIIFILFVPIFGAVLSSVILPGETISPNIALALLLVCAGIVLANFSKTKQ